MAALPEPVKARIVQGLACFDTPSQVAKDVYAEFDLTVTPQHCESYDPTKAAGAKVGKKRRAEIEADARRYVAELRDRGAHAWAARFELMLLSDVELDAIERELELWY